MGGPTDGLTDSRMKLNTVSFTSFYVFREYSIGAGWGRNCYVG